MNLKYLTETYQPEQIIFRDLQIEEIKKSIESYKLYGKGNCLLVRGRTGSGKTSTIKNIISNYNGFLKYTSTRENRKSIELFRALTGNTYTSKSKLIQSLIEQINKHPQGIIIDEITNIKDFKDLMNDLNHIYRETQLPIIVITNHFNFINLLEDDVRLTLLFNVINFESYYIEELKGILDYRLNLAEVVIPEEIKLIMCGVASKEGSARLLLDIAYNCVKDNNYNIENIRSRVIQFETDETNKYILKQTNLNEKKVLGCLISLKGMGQNIITSQDLSKGTNLSKSTISRALDNFEIQLGIITTEERNMGRGKGKLRIIYLAELEYDLLKGLEL